MKCVCIIGSTGMLGSVLLHKLSNLDIKVVSISRKKIDKKRLPNYRNNIIFKEEIDINDFNSLVKIIKDFPVDFIVNCVGIIKQKKEAEDLDVMYSVNAIYPNKLSVIADLFDIKLIHISTDCVFSGTKGNYSELHKFDANDNYGISKALGEVKSRNCLTLRTSIIGHELYSKNSLLEWFLSQKKSVKGYKNAIFSGFTNLELSQLIIKIMESFQYLEGIYNLASSPINKYDLLTLIAKEYKFDIDILPYENFSINRSLNGSKFKNETGIVIKSWEVMIKELNYFYKNSNFYV